MLQARNAAKEGMDGFVRKFATMPEAYQNDHSCVRKLSGCTFDSLRKNLTCRKSLKTTNCQNWGCGRLHGVGPCTG